MRHETRPRSGRSHRSERCHRTAGAPPAHAGYWAVTVLDPLPRHIQPHQTYTIGYWIMQHAAHPYDGDYGPLGKTGLEIVDGHGTAHEFGGVRLGQASHYATTLAIPHTGTWRLYAHQGRFGTQPHGVACGKHARQLRGDPP